MKIVWNAFGMAFKQIGRNAMRSFLTTLGITIGVAAVIGMVSLGQSATARVNQDLASLGPNLIFVVPGAGPGSGRQMILKPFDLGDVAAIEDEVRGVRAIAPVTTSAGTAVFGNANHRTQIVGATNDYLIARDWPVTRGQNFTEGEQLAGAPVVLIGETVRDELFGSQNPIGQTIRLNGIALRVVGMLGAKGQSTMGQDQDDLVILPLKTFQRRVAGNRDVGVIFISANSEAAMEPAKREIEAILHVRRHTRPGVDPDFQVRDMNEAAAVVGSVTAVLTSLLAAIAAISLLVGGIGIMNIMLVSVTERTREIGTRLAIGARSRDVLLQFLIEAIVLAVIGGAMGIATGLGGSFLVTRQLDLPFVVEPAVVVLAVAFSAIVGVTFGFFPARKAARLNPIDALRHE